MQKVILTTGGTGGHIFPALAVAEELRRQHPHVEILFVGSQYGPERDLAQKAGLKFIGLPVRGFLGRGIQAIGAAYGMSKALIHAIKLMRHYKPQAVVGFGSYAAFAPVMAARLCGIPTAIHEQNAVAGMSNRVLSRFANKVFISMPQTQGFAENKCVLTGNPVREAVLALRHTQHDFSRKRLLIVGGSQGAKALNDAIIEHLHHLQQAGIHIQHQTGSKDYERVRAAYTAAQWTLTDGTACVSAFIDNMAEAYATADLVLCRAGASTVAELTAAGRGSVLIPFPFATHDHQTYNARLLAEHGAAYMFAEKDMCIAMAKVLELFENTTALQTLGACAAEQFQGNAAQILAQQIHQLVEKLGTKHAQ